MSDLTSLQPLGDARVLVVFEINKCDGKPNVAALGVYIEAEFVEASCFSEDQLGRWEASIQLEELEAA